MQTGRYNYITPDEFQAMIDYIPELKLRKYKAIDVEYLYRISYWCGLRITESGSLKKEDFDLASKIVFLGKTKTEEHGKAQIPDPFLPSLSRYLDRHKAGDLIPGCNRWIVHQWLDKTGKALGIKALTTSQEQSGEKTKCHIFRKSIGKDMLAGTWGDKADLPLVQKQLRHKDLGNTSIYVQAEAEAVKDYWNRSADSVSS